MRHQDPDEAIAEPSRTCGREVKENIFVDSFRCFGRDKVKKRKKLHFSCKSHDCISTVHEDSCVDHGSVEEDQAALLTSCPPERNGD